MSESFRETLRAGRPAGSWLSIPSPQVAEQTALAGFDFVVVDTEHAPAGVESVEAMVRAVAAADADVAPLVRVAWNDPVRIKRVLDTGAAGVMIPQVNTVAEAEALVDATRYPPDGQRGVAASRASGYGRTLAEYFERADERIATVAQVETPEAAARVGALSAVEGLDSLFVGPADLSAALGVFGEYDADPFVEAVASVLDASDVPVGTLATSPAEVDRWAELGFDYQIVGTDAGYLARGAAESLAAYRD